jgi:hypothetical protein
MNGGGIESGSSHQVQTDAAKVATTLSVNDEFNRIG